MGAAVALLLLAVVALRAVAIVALMHSDADLAAPLVMAEEAHRYPDAQLATGRLGWWGGLWFLQLIRPLPGNSYVGSYLPLLLTVAVAFGVALQAGRLWGPRAPWVVLLVAFGVGAETWANFAAWSSRSPSWWAVGLLGLSAVALARAGPRRVVVGGAVLACGMTAVAASGDQMAEVGLVALAASGAYALRLGSRRIGVGLIVAAAVSFGAGRLIARLADDAGYLRQAFPVRTVDFAQLGSSFSNLTFALQDVWRGAQGGSGVRVGTATTLGSAAGYLGMFLACVAVVTVVRAAARAWRRLGDRDPTMATEDRDNELQRGVWVTFWSVVLVAYLVAFWLTTASGPLGSPVVRYLYGVPLAAAAALAPLAARRRGNVLIAGTVVLGVLAAASLVLHRPEHVVVAGKRPASPAVMGRITQVAAAEHLTRGYAGYWISYPLVLYSGFKLDVTPVGRCTMSDGVCGMYLHYIDQAYAPQPGVRSFLVIDRSGDANLIERNAYVTDIPPTLKPEKVIAVGDQIEVAIFPYDLATRLEPNVGQLDPRVGRGGPLEPQVQPPTP